MKFEQKEPTIYLIHGKARHGKTTIANMILEMYEKEDRLGCKLMIAEAIKFYAKKLTGWDGTDNGKPRSLLQELGTDLIHDHVNIDFSVTRVVEDVNVLRFYRDLFIVDDIRYINEIEVMKSNFKHVVTIFVERPDFESDLTSTQLAHRAEQTVEHDFDYRLTNTTLEALKEQVIAIIKKEEQK